MKTGSFYSAEEIIKIIDVASAKGMTSVEFPGFKGAFALPARNHTPAISQPQKNHVPARPRDEFTDYRTPFGQYKGRLFDEIPREKIQSYGEFLLRDTGREGLSEMVNEWLDKADRYLRQG